MDTTGHNPAGSLDHDQLKPTIMPLKGWHLAEFA
jgi:hypothetical protein